MSRSSAELILTGDVLQAILSAQPAALIHTSAPPESHITLVSAGQPVSFTGQGQAHRRNDNQAAHRNENWSARIGTAERFSYRKPVRSPVQRCTLKTALVSSLSLPLQLTPSFFESMQSILQ